MKTYALFYAAASFDFGRSSTQLESLWLPSIALAVASPQRGFLVMFVKLCFSATFSTTPHTQ